jgi:cysteinyl-tRNA synthetase
LPLFPSSIPSFIKALKKLDRFRGLLLEVLASPPSPSSPTYQEQEQQQQEQVQEDEDQDQQQQRREQQNRRQSPSKAHISGAERAAVAACTAAAGVTPLVRAACQQALSGFKAAMNDDLNTPKAGASLFGLLKQIMPRLLLNEEGGGGAAAAVAAASAAVSTAGDTKDDDLPCLLPLSYADAACVFACLEAFNAALGIFYDLPLSFLQELEAKKKNGVVGSGGGGVSPAAAGASGGAGVSEAVLELVAQRSAAKEEKNWEKADSLRAQILEAGFEVKDVKGGGAPLVTPVSS